MSRVTKVKVQSVPQAEAWGIDIKTLCSGLQLWVHSTDWGIAFLYLISLILVSSDAILSFTVGKRAFCHYGCWMAPFVMIGTKIKSWLKWPSLQLVAATDKCKQCATCEKNCPMSLKVRDMVQGGSMYNGECILCGTCVDHCPNRVIRYLWTNKG